MRYGIRYNRGNLAEDAVVGSGYNLCCQKRDRRVFCALSERRIGIDAEELERQIDLRLADKILSPREKEQYDAAPDKHLALLTFWVLKEAAAKCSGEGLRGYPRNTDFSLDDKAVTVRDGCLLAVIEEDDYAV